MIKINSNGISSQTHLQSSKTISYKKQNSHKATSLSKPSSPLTNPKNHPSASEEKNYDLKEVLRIHKKGFSEIPTKKESDYYWSARKSDPELDQWLYEKDKAEALKFVNTVQSILLKASSGTPLTKEEEALVKNDPVLQQEIMRRKGISFDALV